MAKPAVQTGISFINTDVLVFDLHHILEYLAAYLISI